MQIPEKSHFTYPVPSTMLWIFCFIKAIFKEVNEVLFWSKHFEADKHMEAGNLKIKIERIVVVH